MKASKIILPEDNEPIQGRLFAADNAENTVDNHRSLVLPDFPHVSRSPEDFRKIVLSGEAMIGLDFEFNTSTLKPSIVGVALEDRVAALKWTPDLYAVLRDGAASGSRYAGHSVIGAERPLLEKVGGEPWALDVFEDSMVTHYLANSALCKAAGKEEDGDSGAMGFMDLWTTASMVFDTINWKVCRGIDCEGPCPTHRVFEYCGIDAWASLLAVKHHLKLMAERGTSYAFYREKMRLGDICYRMERRGVNVDRAGVATLEKRFEEKKESLFPQGEDGTWKWFNPRSPQQAMAWYRERGVHLDSIDKESIRKAFLALAKNHGLDEESMSERPEDAPPIPEALEVLWRHLEYKRAGKGFDSWFADRYFGPDGKLHPRFISTGASTGRLSSAKPNCFDAATEVLTGSGWLRMDELQAGTKVAQYENGEIEFVMPDFLTTRVYTGDMVRLVGEGYNLRVTADHDCYYVRKDGREVVLKAIDVPAQSKSLQQLNAGIYNPHVTPRLSPDQLRYLIAVQADGSFTPRGVDFSFKKKRKYQRLLKILVECGLEFFDASDEDRYRIYVYETESRWRLRDKSFCPEFVMSLGRDMLDVFCEEVLLWDGRKGTRAKTGTRKPFHGSSSYCSKQRENAEAVQIAMILSGRRASLCRKNNAGRTYWRVDILNHDRSGIGSIRKSVEHVSNERVYCLSVPSSHVVVRRYGKVCITNQCQNIPSRGFGDMVRACIIPHNPETHDLIKCDFSNLEMRMAAWQGGKDPAELGEDPFAWLLTQVPGKFEQVAETLKNGFSARDIAKITAHANTNLAGITLLTEEELRTTRYKKMIADGALRVYHPDFDPRYPEPWFFRGRVVAFTGVLLAEHLFGNKSYESRAAALRIQDDIYNAAFPAIRNWHRKIMAEIENSPFVRSLTGRTLDLYGTDEEDAKTAATAHSQGTSADHVQAIMLLLDDEGKLPTLQVHDEVVMEIPKTMTDEEALEYMACMGRETPLLPGSLVKPDDPTYPGFRCAAKIKRGPNWGEMKMIGKV
jgi:hypothetical protein